MSHWIQHNPEKESWMVFQTAPNYFLFNHATQKQTQLCLTVLLISESDPKLVAIFCTNVEKVPLFEIIPQCFDSVDCIKFIIIYNIVFIGASEIS